MIDLIGHVGYVLLLLGSILIGHKHPTGWLLRLAGQLIWVGLGTAMGMSSIWVWGIAFVIIDYMNWRKWNAPTRKPERE